MRVKKKNGWKFILRAVDIKWGGKKAIHTQIQTIFFILHKITKKKKKENQLPWRSLSATLPICFVYYKCNVE